MCCIFRVCALHMTGWKPALNIGIGRLDHAKFGTSDIGIRPESVVLYCWLGTTRKTVSEMTYNVLSGMLNTTIPYHSCNL